MELKPGYKQTEVGVIPEEWEDANLGRIAQIRMCKRIFAGQTNRSGDIPFFKIGTFGKTPDAFISCDLYREYRRKYSFPKHGDILLSAAGTLGKTVIYDGQDAYFQDSNIVWLEVDSEKILNEYLYQCYQVMKWASPEGSTISRLYNGIIRATRIPLPPTLDEQRAIATALSDVDALLEELDQLIAKKRDLKQAAMQQLLIGETRLPGFEGEWELRRLSEICAISVGTSKSSAIVADGDYWVCDMGSVSTEGRLIVSKRTNHCGDFLDHGDLIMPKDDIGGGKIIGRAAYIDADKTYVLGDHVYRLKAIEVDSRFLAYVINSHSLNADLRKKVIGSAQLGLARKSVEEQEVRLPRPAEQTAIAAVLSDMDAEIEALEQRRAKTVDLKQAMMQELLTGRTRLV